MFEVYAFLLMFPVQILVLSVVFPAALIRYTRTQAPNLSAERCAQLFPGVDLTRSVERFVTRLRVTTLTVAFLGLVLWGWLYNFMTQPGWDQRTVVGLTCGYFGVQAFALLLEFMLSFGTYLKLLKHPPSEGRRKAVLQRRGLFDFVSPFAVGLAILCYFLFAAFMIYLYQRGAPAKTTFAMIGCVTLVYLLDAVTLYVMLYKSRILNPLETQENRGHWIGLQVKGTIYSCIFIVVFLAIMSVLDLLDQKAWGPFALSTFFIGCSLSFFVSLAAAPRRAQTQELGSSPVS